MTRLKTHKILTQSAVILGLVSPLVTSVTPVFADTYGIKSGIFVDNDTKSKERFAIGAIDKIDELVTFGQKLKADKADSQTYDDYFKNLDNYIDQNQTLNLDDAFIAAIKDKDLDKTLSELGKLRYAIQKDAKIVSKPQNDRTGVSEGIVKDNRTASVKDASEALDKAQLAYEAAVTAQEAAKKAKDQAEKDLQTAQNARDIAQSSVKESNVQLEAATAAKEAGSKELTKLKEELKSYNETIAKSEKELEDARVVNDKAKIAKLSSVVESQKIARKGLETKISDTEKALESADAKISLAKVTKEKADTSINEANAKILTAEEALKQADKDLVEANKRVEVTEKELQEAKAKFESVSKPDGQQSSDTQTPSNNNGTTTTNGGGVTTTNGGSTTQGTNGTSVTTAPIATTTKPVSQQPLPNTGSKSNVLLVVVGAAVVLLAGALGLGGYLSNKKSKSEK